jgi:4-amino-4-deoxy-L-arabinose transferase-like glycosyltransferase
VGTTATSETRAVRAATTSRGGARDVLLVAALAALLLLPPLGQHMIAKSDEARFALLAQDMLRRGIWFDAQVEGQVYRNKPPLYPWAIKVLSLPGGRVTQATAQAPSTLAAIAAAVMLVLLGRDLFGRRAGLWAAFVLLTGASFFSHSQQMLPDMLVVAFGVAAAAAFWRAVNGPRPRVALVLFHVALAMGVFAKGPVGLLPMLVAAIWLIGDRGLRGLGALWSPLGLAAFAAVTVGWLAPYLALGAGSFGQNVVVHDWLGFYLGWPNPRRVAQFILDGLVGFLPWSIVIPIALAAGARSRREPAVRYALLALLVPLVAIILSFNRLDRYLLPVYPGAALLVAWWADARAASPTRGARITAWVALIGIAAALAAIPFIPAVGEAQLDAVPGVAWKLPALGALVLLLGVVAFRGLREGRPALLIQGGALIAAIAFAWSAWLIDQWTNRTQDFPGLAAALRHHARDGDFRLLTQAKLLPLDFYMGRELPRLRSTAELERYLASTDRPVALVDAQNRRRMGNGLPAGIRVLQQFRVHEQDLFIVGR